MKKTYEQIKLYSYVDERTILKDFISTEEKYVHYTLIPVPLDNDCYYIIFEDVYSDKKYCYYFRFENTGLNEVQDFIEDYINLNFWLEEN